MHPTAVTGAADAGTAGPGQADAVTVADTAAVVARLLGQVLGREVVLAEWTRTFRDLDVDSVHSAEFARLVSAACGVPVQAPDLLDHPTPQALAHYLTACRERRRSPKELADQAVPLPPASACAGGAGGAGGVGGEGGHRPGSPSGAAGSGHLLESLRGLLAGTLCCDAWELDPVATFAALDLDSVSGAEFIALVNLTHGLTLRPTDLFDHPTLTALAAHIRAVADGRS